MFRLFAKYLIERSELAIFSLLVKDRESDLAELVLELRFVEDFVEELCHLVAWESESSASECSCNQRVVAVGERQTVDCPLGPAFARS